MTLIKSVTGSVIIKKCFDNADCFDLGLVV